MRVGCVAYVSRLISLNKPMHLIANLGVQLQICAVLTTIVCCHQQAIAATANRLRDDFIAASQFDPEFQAAIAQRDAGLELQEQAQATLLPQVTASFQRSINNTDSRSQTVLGPIDRSFQNYPAYSASLQIRQALYRPKAWASLAQSRAQARYAELILQGAKQDLGLRLIGLHAEWAAAQVAREAAQESIVILRQLASIVLRQFDAGDATKVDIEIAQSKLAQAQTQLAESQLALENAKLGWAQITGRHDPAGKPTSFNLIKDSTQALPERSFSAITWHDRAAQRLPLNYPSLQSIQSIAIDNSPVLQAQREAVQVAEAELRKVAADHYPVADLFAARSKSASAQENTVGTSFSGAQVGIQVSVPLYSGGAVDSAIRQAQANLRKVQNDLQAAINRLNLQIDRDWRTLEAARVDVSAQARLLEALIVVTESTVRGQTAGIATTVDTLQAKLQALNAQRDLARATSRAVVAWIRLMGASGLISEETLLELDKLIAL
ncbi:MAG: hypothetical protein EB121_00810 [Alphaproteobacteria bacterium]|nr:hypothetical protein [Betaproteobacteria bacterium]NDG03884.1 hypothetical protein [Alphaproteobacteria bacterium]NBP39353.1 hypothetical protein [Betaproteobacteria bacterium]NBQ79538.1 hypothetical protein [Betaproteobacteria bacterium]NBT82626.1 hypothetical protein [Betaproteobacteria bacterium]